MSVTGQDIVNAAYEVLGAPYRTWYLGMSLPTWLDDWRGDPPPASHLQSVGLECADLVAYAQARNGLSYPYWAGTQSYEYNLVNTSTFDPTTPGEPGAIALSPYRGPAWNDQGHIAIFVDEHRLIQALARGVSDQFTDTETWGWGGSTEFSIYGHLPGVDYSAGGGEGNGSGETPTGWQWLGITNEGWAQFDGPDCSRGWFDANWTFHPESWVDPERS